MGANNRTPSLLVIDDEKDAADLEREYLEEAGYRVATTYSVTEAAGWLESNFVDLILADERIGADFGTHFLAECRSRVPGLGAVLVTAYADLDTALRAMRAGTLDLLEKPIDREQLIETVQKALEESAITREARYHRWEAARREKFPEIIGRSPAIKKVLDSVRKVMATAAPVLIEGESGSGKELIARAIHFGGSRRNGPFIAVNAGALPDTLLESTLFGSKKGAYTDAKTDQTGLFKAADGGTLFLDEIGETSANVQVRLLRALQEKAILPVGDTKSIAVDVRVIAATNRDLNAMVGEGRFRQDLYYRLAVTKFNVPPLRERPEDIETLAGHFLEKHSTELGKPIRKIQQAAIEKLVRYVWPGNIRELDNVIQRAVIFAEGNTITPELLTLEPPGAGAEVAGAMLDREFREAELEFEKQYFKRLLKRTRNNKSRAAAIAGLERTVLHAHLKKIGWKDDEENPQ